MNSYAGIVVTEHMESLRRDAALQRQLPGKPSLPQRLASVLRTARQATMTEAPTASTMTPSLSDYPYRS
jgi:hypothetical protein